VVTSNILNRTLFISAAEYGSAVVITVNSIEYVVTAKHLLPLTKAISIKIRSNETWVEYKTKEIGRSPGEIDIAVLQIDKQFIVGHLPATPDIRGLVLGQDVFFVGFPYKLEGPVGFVQDQRPLGYVKKGTVSALDSPHHPALVIDAINNEGFSGGPIVFAEIGKPANELKIAAIVSKYRTEQEGVIGPDGQKTGETVDYNTGFLYAYSIRYALDLIYAHRALTPLP
jgi:S1-C subfamily serine protease